MTYHLARNGQQLGTVSREEAQARYARGELLPTDLVWTEGMPNWAPASTVFGNAPAAGTPPASGAVPPIGTTTPVGTAAPVASAAGGGSAFTVPPGATSAAGGPPPAKPDNYLIWSILATVLCCLPAGIVAIVYSTQVDSKYQRGDYAGAEAAAKNAKTWTIVSAVVGLLLGAGWAIFSVMAGISAAGAGY